jgi:hypothetical protein
MLIYDLHCCGFQKKVLCCVMVIRKNRFRC